MRNLVRPIRQSAHDVRQVTQNVNEPSIMPLVLLYQLIEPVLELPPLQVRIVQALAIFQEHVFERQHSINALTLSRFPLAALTLVLFFMLRFPGPGKSGPDFGDQSLQPLENCLEIEQEEQEPWAILPGELQGVHSLAKSDLVGRLYQLHNLPCTDLPAVSVGECHKERHGIDLFEQSWIEHHANCHANHKQHK